MKPSFFLRSHHSPRSLPMSHAPQSREAAEVKKEGARAAAQPDDLIDFVQLKSKKGLSQIEIEDEVTTGEEGCGGQVY